MGTEINKKIGGLGRAKIAREELRIIFSNPSDPLYFSKDIDYAKKFDVTRHTIYKIRKDLKIPSRSERILQVLKKLKPVNLTLKKLSAKLNVKYQNLYKIVTDNKVTIKKE
jgi:predicted transcriptional regulator